MEWEIVIVRSPWSVEKLRTTLEKKATNLMKDLINGAWVVASLTNLRIQGFLKFKENNLLNLDDHRPEIRWRGRSPVINKCPEGNESTLEDKIYYALFGLPSKAYKQ